MKSIMHFLPAVIIYLYNLTSRYLIALSKIVHVFFFIWAFMSSPLLNTFALELNPVFPEEVQMNPV